MILIVFWVDFSSILRSFLEPKSIRFRSRNPMSFLERFWSSPGRLKPKKPLCCLSKTSVFEESPFRFRVPPRLTFEAKIAPKSSPKTDKNSIEKRSGKSRAPRSILELKMESKWRPKSLKNRCRNRSGKFEAKKSPELQT